MDLKQLKTKLFVDGASISHFQEMFASGMVSGATTNPSLCRKAGVSNYLEFCADAATKFAEYPLSLEVIADSYDEMYRQALRLSSLGKNIYVKVPVINTKGDDNYKLIDSLSCNGVKVNVTAVFTHKQINDTFEHLVPTVPSYISVFAGRIADAGQCPIPYVQHAIHESEGTETEVIWASVREPYNILQAQSIGCHVITVFHEMLRKLHLFGKDLNEFSVETVQMFYRDACESGYVL